VLSRVVCVSVDGRGDVRMQTFNDFELEAHMECTYDRLEIFDGKDTSSRQLGRLCGSGLPSPVVSTGSRLYMTFYTDASVQRKGFDITHTTGYNNNNNNNNNN